MTEKDKEGSKKEAKKKKKKEEAAEEEIDLGIDESSYEPRLKKLYREEVVPALMKKFGYKNIMQVPKLVKIVINMGLGEGVQNPKLIDDGVAQLSLIAGQRPVVTRAKRAIASFRLRAGMPIGVKVTLRKDRMWEFLDRLISIALPRVKDFKGVSPKAFDGRGNYTLGLEEQTIFPEIDYNKVEKIKGMNITVVTTAETDEEGYELLKLLGMPFRER
ncbi:MAG TPA: 50S ribosomal protein L5 [Proteobacteria bacterium]|nr:50S ribosomal protein L5 [Pseudomonadota bacterium]